MASATNHDAYGNPAWGSGPAGGPSSGSPSYGSPWGPPPWVGRGWHDVPPWARDIPRPVWIAFMVIGFIFWWPVGLAMLIYLMASGRMGCGRRARYWANQANGYEPERNGGGGWDWKRWGGGDRTPPGSGNRAFDEYRMETLRRLEEEQREFGAFLDRLRVAKDKAEFDQFMAERRTRPPQPQDSPEPPVT